MERVFPDAGEFEARHRAAGLHRWYRVNYDEGISATKAQADLAAAKSGDPEELQKAKDEAAQYKNELDAMKLAESLREMRGKVAKAKNIPAELLTGDTEEACTAQADQILAFAKVPAAPTLPNPGEPTGAAAKPDTAQQFAEWAKDLI